ncbi:MAG: hypothetical protein JWM42_3542 [Burkholderia sp.]|nr:hypothetical protein [Burkholderia sp.]
MLIKMLESTLPGEFGSRLVVARRRVDAAMNIAVEKTQQLGIEIARFFSIHAKVPQFTAKQYISPAPPVLSSPSGLQPRDG